MPALTAKAANAPPSISHAPREADLFAGPWRDRRRIGLIVTNLADLLISICSLPPRKRENVPRVMRFLRPQKKPAPLPERRSHFFYTDRLGTCRLPVA